MPDTIFGPNEMLNFWKQSQGTEAKQRLGQNQAFAKLFIDSNIHEPKNFSPKLQ